MNITTRTAKNNNKITSEVKQMKNKTNSIVKGLGVGMLVGGATAIIGGSMMGGKKTNYKKMAQKAIKTAENFMDNMM